MLNGKERDSRTATQPAGVEHPISHQWNLYSYDTPLISFVKLDAEVETRVWILAGRLALLSYPF